MFSSPNLLSVRVERFAALVPVTVTGVPCRLSWELAVLEPESVILPPPVAVICAPLSALKYWKLVMERFAPEEVAA